jgi:hypothetical protein
LTLLLVTGVLSVDEALAGFANPGVITVAVLYVSSPGSPRPAPSAGSARRCSVAPAARRTPGSA